MAEKLVYGETSDGAASDLAEIGVIARRMVAAYGMNEQLGAINYQEVPPVDGHVAIRRRRRG